MTLPDGPALSHTANHDRLNGWKDIASFLGKSVRTAQRWEQELRLPVRRIHTAAGEIVYASRHELDEWLKRVGETRPDAPPSGNGLVAPAVQAAEQYDNEPAPAATPGAAPRRVRLLVPLLITAIVIAGTLALALVVSRRGETQLSPGARPENAVGVPGQPTSWKVQGDTLTVFDAGGRSLWAHRFGSRLREDVYTWTGDLATPTVLLEDLDGDGRTEVLFREFPASFGPPYRFYGFESDGRLRFAYAPPMSVRFGDTDYGGPFSVAPFVVTPGPDGQKNIWLTVQHYQEFPTLVQKLGPRGESLGEYWTNGHSPVIAPATVGDRPVILIGGTSNESWGGALTVLEHDRPNGSVPAETSKYRCSSCPAGGPLAYFVFPRTEICTRTGERAYVWEIRAEPGGRIRVAVFQGEALPGDASSLKAMTYYTLDSDLRIVDAEFGDDYRRAHARLEAAGMFTHPFDPREERELFPVRSWDGTKFVKIEKLER